MNREQVLAIAKPILYNTPMTQAVLEDRKTATRRLVKPQPLKCTCEDCEKRDEIYFNARSGYIRCRNCNSAIYNGKGKFCFALYNVGDILYVREAFRKVRVKHPGRAVPQGWKGYEYDFRADEIANSDGTPIKWRPSIHMPKEAARIFLKVTDVRVERLQDITKEDAIKEGAETDEYLEMEEVAGIIGVQCQTLRDYFGRAIWDSTIKTKADYDKYGWDANPWVWVVEFERIEVDE